MECYCDFDPADAYCQSDVKARKQHVCSECSGHIEPGETYQRTFMVYDGRCDVWKTCPDCRALLDYVRAHVPCLCWLHGSLIDDCMAAAQEYAREGPGLLFGAYRRKIATDRRATRRWKQ